MRNGRASGHVVRVVVHDQDTNRPAPPPGSQQCPLIGGTLTAHGEGADTRHPRLLEKGGKPHTGPKSRGYG